MKNLLIVLLCMVTFVNCHAGETTIRDMSNNIPIGIFQ